MSGIKESLAYTTNMFVEGNCIENFKKKKDTDKAISVLVTAVATIGVGILMGVIPVIGPVVSVPFALIAGVYTFARSSQPDLSLFNSLKRDDKMKAMTWTQVWERIKTFKCFTEFKHLHENKQIAIITLTASTTVSVGIISGAMLGGVPVLGALAAVALAALAGLAVFSYLSASAQGVGDKLDNKFNGSGKEAEQMQRGTVHAIDAARNILGGLGKTVEGLAAASNALQGKGNAASTDDPANPT